MHFKPKYVLNSERFFQEFRISSPNSRKTFFSAFFSPKYFIIPVNFAVKFSLNLSYVPGGFSPSCRKKIILKFKINPRGNPLYIPEEKLLSKCLKKFSPHSMKIHSEFKTEFLEKFFSKFVIYIFQNTNRLLSESWQEFSPHNR